MDQGKIANLLFEASMESCPKERFEEIKHSLTAEVVRGPHPANQAHYSVVRSLMEAHDTEGKREYLPYSLPTIVRLCGDRKDARSIVAPVDFDAFDKLLLKAMVWR